MPPKAHVLYRFSSQAVTLWGIGETIRRRGLERKEVTSLRAGLGRGDKDPGSLFVFLLVFWTS